MCPEHHETRFHDRMLQDPTFINCRRIARSSGSWVGLEFTSASELSLARAVVLLRPPWCGAAQEQRKQDAPYARKAHRFSAHLVEL